MHPDSFAYTCNINMLFQAKHAYLKKSEKEYFELNHFL